MANRLTLHHGKITLVESIQLTQMPLWILLRGVAKFSIPTEKFAVMQNPSRWDELFHTTTGNRGYGLFMLKKIFCQL